MKDHDHDTRELYRYKIDSKEEGKKRKASDKEYHLLCICLFLVSGEESILN